MIFFLIPVQFYTKTPPGKSPIIVENAWEQRMFTTMQKAAASVAEDDFKLGGNPETAKKFTFKATSPDIHVFQRYK